MFRKAILVAGDAGLLDVLRDSFLAREGFLLLPAATGQDAFGLVEEQDPALGILDIDRPDLAECCQRLQSDRQLQHTPLLLLTSPARSAQPPAVSGEFVAKPVDKDCLLTAACRLLRISRRAAPRLPVRFPAQLGRPGGKFFPGQVCNLSTGGAFVETSHLFPVDTPVVLSVPLPGAGGELCCRGRIAWVNHPEWIKKEALPPGLGVQFLSLTDREKSVLAAWEAKEENGEFTASGFGSPSCTDPGRL